jgi:heat-inducible transcriptional repressor
LIVRGASNLLERHRGAERSGSYRVRTLFDDIERKNDLIGLLDWREKARACTSLSARKKTVLAFGSSIVAAPYADAKGKSGWRHRHVIGPTRLKLRPYCSHCRLHGTCGRAPFGVDHPVSEALRASCRGE